MADEAIDWQATSEFWRKACLEWQEWAGRELEALGLQLEGGTWGSEPARKRLSEALRREGGA